MSKRISIIPILLLLAGTLSAKGQTGLAAITGRVTDTTGAVVPGAMVRVTNNATSVSAETKTNEVGIYLVADLVPGTYRVRVSAPHFVNAVREDLTLHVDDRVGLDWKLQPGGDTETVTVKAQTPLLHKEDVQVGEVMDNALISEIPNLAAQGEVRDVLGAMQLAGDVQGSGGRAGMNLGINGSLTAGENNDVRVNGGRTSGTEYLVDGIPITQNLARQISNTVPTVEDTSEFKVVTNGLGAQYGHLSGGAVDLATEAGTSKLHGNYFDFSQLAAFDANTWVNDDTDTKKPGFHQNDFGFAMGGPVYIPHVYHGQKRTFWFANYEGSRYHSGGNAVINNVPTAQERTGDMTDIGNGPNDPNFPYPMMYDPYGPTSYPNTVIDPITGDAGQYQRYNLLGGDGRHVPANYLDPIIQEYLKYVPLPNYAHYPNMVDTQNYKATPTNDRSTDVWSVRIDQSFSDKSRMFGRFTHNNGSNVTGPGLGPLSGISQTITPGGWGLTLNWNYTFSPTFLMDLRAGGNYTPWSSGTFLPSGFDNTDFHFDPVTEALIGQHNIVPIDGPVTDAQGPGVGSGNLGPTNAGTNLRNSTNIVYAGALTKILQRHTLQFGYEGRRYYDNQENSAEQTGGDEFRFSAQAVDQYSEDYWNPQAYANGLGQFLMGLYSWNQSNGSFARSVRLNYYAAYIQDDFRMRKNLTLNLGLRWETESPATDPHNSLTVWDPNAPSPFTVAPGWSWATALSQAQTSSGTPSPLTQAQINEIQIPGWVSSGFPKGALEFVHTPEHPSKNANDWHPWNFSPRLGAAWQFNPKAVLRGSLDVFYLPTGGSIDAYYGTSGVAYNEELGLSIHNSLQTNYDVQLDPRSYTDPLCGCIESPYFPGQVLQRATTNAALNQEAAASSQAGAVNIHAHMPLEYDWSLGIQYELPHGFLAEADYDGNTSHDLLAKDMPGHFPASLYTGGPSGTNASLYTVWVPSPTAGEKTAGQQQPSGAGGPTIQPLGYLEYGYPYFGELQVQNSNIGKANYNALNLRMEHRLTNGLEFLFNYTFSKDLDDVGGPESNQNGPSQGYGQGGKIPQDTQTIRNLYNWSELDERHRFTAFSLYQIPLGRGRQWANQPNGFAGNAEDWLIGGWNIAGDYIYHPGSPVEFNAYNQGSPDNGDFQFHNIGGNFAPGANINTLKNKNFKGTKSAVYDGRHQTPDLASPVFDVTQFAGAAPFQTGNLPPIYAGVRNPGNWNSDISVSKNFGLFAEDGSRYLQIRMDDLNFLNHPGTPAYNTSFPQYSATDPGAVPGFYFGKIDKEGGGPNTERHIQLGARIVF